MNGNNDFAPAAEIRTQCRQADWTLSMELRRGHLTNLESW